MEITVGVVRIFTHGMNYITLFARLMAGVMSLRVQVQWFCHFDIVAEQLLEPSQYERSILLSISPCQ